jgi:DNA-binding transcriptional LysR family regulator
MNGRNLDELATFLKVAECGSFTGAAREQGLTQSTVSRRIAELEARLGARLIQRTTRRVLLTETGARYAAHVRGLLAGMAEAEADLRREEPVPAGPLRVSIPSGYGRVVLVPLLAEFARAHPAVRLDLDLSDRYVDLLSDGFDFAVRLREPETTGLQVRPSARRIRLLIVAAPGFDHRVQRPADLVPGLCLVQRTYAPRDVWAFRWRGEDHRVPVLPRMVLNDIAAIHAMALAGAGLAILPDFLAEADLRAGRLVRVLDEAEFAEVPVCLVWPMHRAHAPAVVALAQFIG